MGMWTSIRELFTLPTLPESLAFTETEPRPIDQIIIEMSGRGAAPRVSRLEALTVPAIQRGRNLICSISTLPLIQLGPDRRQVRNPLFEQIDPDVPNVVTLAQTVEDLLFEAISWWRITAFDSAGFPVSAQHVDVTSVSVQPPSGRSPSPLPSGEDHRGASVWVDGIEVPSEQMIDFHSPNPGVLKACGRAIRRAILFEQSAAMYAEDPRPLDFFSPTESADPASDEDVAELLRKWREARRNSGTAYVPYALKYNPVDTPTPADLQLVELQKRVALDIANAIGLDPEDLGISTTSRTYQNAVDRRQDRINDVLSPYMRAITDRLSMGDVTRRGHKVAFDLDDYMRADPLTRVAYYKGMQELGTITDNEIREAENLPDLVGGDTVKVLPAPSKVAANGSASLNLSDDSQLTFADVPLSTFSVDTQSRTITGLAVPYNQVALNQGRKWRFSPGSLEYAEIGRVKLLRDHDRSQAVGRAIKLDETAEGLLATFKVARGVDGDRVLALAEDGVLDGLSVGVDIADAIPDTQNKGTYLVRRAVLREVSLTAMPAFDDSRVISVAASRDEGNTMTDNPTTEPQAQTAPAGGPDSAAMKEAFTRAFAEAFASAAPKPKEDIRQVVNITRTPAAFVQEPEPYVFDSKGNLRPGSHDFSTDLVHGLRDKDQAAYDRVMNFIQAQFDVQTTNVTGLNPNRQRPDMYVDQRSYRYPVWETINKGTLSDITPFVFPKFNSAASLVGAHTEGTEPSSGTFTATTQTVTPTAVSGKAKITREVWDQGGNPQVSNLIWRQMVKGWYEALEAAAVSVLDAATPTAIALTAGGGTTGQTLDQELTAAFAALQFVRGGFSMDSMFTQIDLYKALIAATDDSGRRLYPAIGPSNASGTTRSRFAAIDVNGVLALPAWALAATGSVVASSYLFDSEVVHGWATAPQRLDITNTEVAHVYIGIWGYKATAISDINGVREITYDPVP